jgi:SAM-dependent methyltransferase
VIALKQIENLSIGVSAQEIRAAFAPLIDVNATQKDWLSAVWKRRRRVLRRAYERMRGSGSRDLNSVLGEYEEAWSSGYGKYDVSAGPRKAEPWTFRDDRIMVSRLGAARFRSVILGGVIRSLKPKSVLEVGCGDGINLLLLANAFPNVNFTGLELTDAGHRASIAVQRHDRLPDNLSAYAPLPQIDPQAFHRISFVQGNACAMPFTAGSFDLVYTVLSVEQMEQVRYQALSEISRVTGRHLLNLEPFADANTGFWRRLNVYGKDYFRGRIAELSRYSLEVVWATQDFPQDTALGVALVLSRKRPAS